MAMTNFTIKNINWVNDYELNLSVKSGQQARDFRIGLLNSHSVSLPRELEVMINRKEFNFHRDLLQLIATFRVGKKLAFPVDLFASKSREKRLQDA